MYSVRARNSPSLIRHHADSFSTGFVFASNSSSARLIADSSELVPDVTNAVPIFTAAEDYMIDPVFLPDLVPTQYDVLASLLALIALEGVTVEVF